MEGPKTYVSRRCQEPSRPSVLAAGTMLPVTLPVPVLRELVTERFAVSELATSLFMSINMVGALLTAPIAGALSDRWGRRVPLLVGALLVDALCFLALTADVAFPVFLAIRFAEGCAHITALSMLLSLASMALDPSRRGRAMGVVAAYREAVIRGFRFYSYGDAMVILPDRARC